MEQLWRGVPPSCQLCSVVSCQSPCPGWCWPLLGVDTPGLGGAGAPGGWRQQTENMQTISTSTIITCQPGAESNRRNVNINIFHIFQVCGSYFLRPSEPGPGAMVVIKTLDGDTRAGARPPTPQPPSGRVSPWLTQNITGLSCLCHSARANIPLCFSSELMSVVACCPCCHQTLLCPGQSGQAPVPDRFPLITRRRLLTAQSGLSVLSVSSSDALESLANI